MLIDFKDEDFDSKIKNEDVSVIQFSAAWCGPCKTFVEVDRKVGAVPDSHLKEFLDKNI